MATSSLPEGRKLALLAGLAGLAIFGAGMMVWRSVRPSARAKPASDELTFLCDQCSAVFSRERKLLPAEFLAEYAKGRATAIQCPQCGAKTAYLPRRCPACGKYYLTDACRDPSVPLATDPAAERCPHCRTVPYEWYLRHKP